MKLDNINDNIKSTSILVDSVDYPKIKSGGSSSSSVFNRYHDAISKDLAGLVVFINKLIGRVDNFSDAATAQSAALSAPLTSINTRIDTLLLDPKYFMADFFSTNYISYSGNDTVASVDSVFGYVTLPVTSSTNLLTHVDSLGNAQVSSEIELSYSTTTNPQNGNFTITSDGIDMLKRNNIWLMPTPNQPTWVKLRAPLQYLGLNPNVLEISPFPAFGADISSVQYQSAGTGSGGTWVNLDISYVPGYDSVSGTIKKAGPIRIILPGTPISQIRFLMTPNGNYRPGLYNLKVLSNTYSQAGSLSVIDPNGRNITGITIYGKDPTSLATLSTTITASKAKIALSSSSTFTTPVISRVVASLT